MTRRANVGEASQWRLSRDVRIWDIRVREGHKDPDNPAKKGRRSFVVRWTVGGKEHQRTYATRALADAERSKLITHQKQGAAFDVTSGHPEPILREQRTCTWFEHVCRYIDTKWPMIAPKSRRSIADALATVTPSLVSAKGSQPPPELRELVYAWAAVKPARDAGPPPEHLRPALRWIERHSLQLAALADPVEGPGHTRSALDRLAMTLDGGPAAANTIARKRAVFYNVLDYGVELGLLPANPIDHVSWRAPKASETVERAAVVNMRQGRALLRAVAEQGPMGQRLRAFFASMLYAAQRPAEAISLREVNLVSLPEQGWGEFVLRRSKPRSGRAWTDSGESREERGLKHRATSDSRPVPAHPELVAILRDHLDRFGVGPGGFLFTGPRGGLIDENTYLPIWQAARAAVLTPTELTAGLVRRPYDLRHTAVSTWLNAGVPPTQVAEWAGHSVAVLLKVYAKCVVGQDATSRGRIEDALREHPPAEDGSDQQ